MSIDVSKNRYSLRGGDLWRRCADVPHDMTPEFFQGCWYVLMRSKDEKAEVEV